MNAKKMIWAGCCVAALTLAVGAGCSDEHQMAETNHEKMMNENPTIAKANQMISDGKSKKLQAMDLKQQGLTDEANKMMMEGDKMISDGMKMKDQEKMKM